MDKDVNLRTFGSELMMLYGRINLSQSEFASAVGVSSVALRKWESGQSCPKAESVKRVIEILIRKEAFKQGGEQTEARHLWELAMQRGLKVPFDEVWFAGIVSNTSVEVDNLGKETDPRRDRGFSHPSDPAPQEKPLSVPANHALAGSPEALSQLPPKYLSLRSDLCLVPGDDPVQGSDPLPYSAPVSYTDLTPTSPKGLTLAPTEKPVRRKRQLAMLIVLVIILIIGLACALFFYARSHATVHTGLGQQNKMAVVAHGSTMSFYVNEQPPFG